MGNEQKNVKVGKRKNAPPSTLGENQTQIIDEQPTKAVVEIHEKNWQEKANSRKINVFGDENCIGKATQIRGKKK